MDRTRASDPAVLSGCTVGLLFVFGGVFTFFTLLFPTPPGFHPVAVISLATFAVIFGLVALTLPWARIPRLVRLAIGPGAMAVIAAHNIAAGLDAFRYGMLFFLVFIWLGLCEPRGTSVLMSPFILAAYLLPLLGHGASSSALSSTSYAVPLYLAVGEVLAWRSAGLRQVQERLQHLATHDPLTDLPNRAMFGRALDRARVDHSTISVLFLDLDGFKQINDRFGHAAGDDVLLGVAGVLRGLARTGSSDLPCRLAGDEFVMLLPNTELADARPVADRVVARLAALTGPDGNPLRGSVGVAGGRATESEQILAAADQAMYAAKRAGTGPVTVACAA
ncbi:hypothetical protein GCM10023107_57720 [Actinoplanes octamycinicus]|uniref:GGDEF domain-containing protein n=1 Tax=Actinoplanes octamycinicus TaxID=135948 RepID=UPI001A5C51A8|nr:GGDEF domain-containing protein [Actinoplanes octamycinicus]GIE59791.1 hypothetical protein Aoc01nite_51930 [Actinoplanes octamycinicus]